MFHGNTHENSRSWSTVHVYSGTLHYNGTTYFTDNQNGGLHTINTNLSIIGDTIFEGNESPLSGAAINISSLMNTYVHLCRNMSFIGNKSDYGGAISVSGSLIYIQGNILFENNTAVSGSAMYILSNIVLMNHTQLNFSNINSALQCGGAIHTTLKCNEYSCFMLICDLTGVELDIDIGNSNIGVLFHYNRAEIAGSALFGGSLDRCTIITSGQNIANVGGQFYERFFLQ